MLKYIVLLGIIVVIAFLFFKPKASYEFRLDINESRSPKNIPTSTMETLKKLPFPLIPVIVQNKSPNPKANPSFKVSLTTYVSDSKLQEAQLWLNGVVIKSIQIGGVRNDNAFIFPKYTMNKGSMSLYMSEYVALTELSLIDIESGTIDGKISVIVKLEDNGVEKILEYKFKSKDSDSVIEDYLTKKNASLSTPIVIDESKTLVKEYGTVYFLTTEAYLKSGDIKDTIPGLGPVLVEKNGNIVEFPSSVPFGVSLQKYEEGRETGENIFEITHGTRANVGDISIGLAVKSAEEVGLYISYVSDENPSDAGTSNGRTKPEYIALKLNQESIFKAGLNTEYRIKVLDIKQQSQSRGIYNWYRNIKAKYFGNGGYIVGGSDAYVKLLVEKINKDDK